ncbi:MAG: lysylphosphatidylglycerol synthase transmembrane domain-containing protein [Kofleriaceae bacterium]
MKLAINLALSLAMLALCTWLIWPEPMIRAQIAVAVDAIDLAAFWPYVAGYLGLMAVVHFARSWRWNNLLAALGIKVPAGPLLAISSVGFMAILALPARMGEFARPALVRQRGVSASAALGTVAVERIIDGLMISILVFGAFFSLRGPGAPGWMMPTAYIALGVFGAAMLFLVFAMSWPRPTVTFCLKLSLLPRLAPRVARAIETKLLEMIRGFGALRDRPNLIVFLLWTLVYWVANGFTLWLLARGLGQPLTVLGAFATMGMLAVGITLPNSPGMVGQFQYFTILGLSLYLGADASTEGTALYATALTLATIHYLLQVIWYVGMGALALATPWVSLADLRRGRKLASTDGASDAPA